MGVRVEQAARAFCTLQPSGSSGDRVLHEKPCAVLNEARQKTLADVVRRPKCAISTLKNRGLFDYWLLNDAADKFELA
jgi:hypothetical protein